MSFSVLMTVMLFLGPDTEAVQVIGGNVTVVQGGSAFLPCQLIDTTEAPIQISWQRKTREKVLVDNFFTVSNNVTKFLNGKDPRFSFIGDFYKNNGSLLLSGVTLKDEGTYTCIFSLLYKNHQTEIPLNVLVLPLTSLKDSYATLGDEEVSLATCTAAVSRPPVDVRFDTGALGEKVRSTTSFTHHPNGTTTTVSSLLGTPTRQINHQVVRCVVSGGPLSNEETLPFTIQVYFSPMEVNIIEGSQDSFECMTEANPRANYTWTRSGQPLPPSAVRVEDAVLHFQSMSADLNGLYQCEASNPYGKKQGKLFVHVVSGSCAAAWTLFSLLLISVVLGAAGWYLYKSGKFPRTGQGTHSGRQQVPADPSSPEQADTEDLQEEGRF